MPVPLQILPFQIGSPLVIRLEDEQAFFNIRCCDQIIAEIRIDTPATAVSVTGGKGKYHNSLFRSGYPVCVHLRWSPVAVIRSYKIPVMIKKCCAVSLLLRAMIPRYRQTNIAEITYIIGSYRSTGNFISCKEVIAIVTQP